MSYPDSRCTFDPATITGGCDFPEHDHFWAVPYVYEAERQKPALTEPEEP